MANSDKKILEAVIKLKDDMSKQLNKTQSSLKKFERNVKNTNKITAPPPIEANIAVIIKSIFNNHANHLLFFISYTSKSITIIYKIKFIF